ncbi:MAG TPA: single-stranded DNA-binding protein [Acidimicrobiales bacterium]|nr:single-stranded DNA-binding protein [Acidimicrobiales bacterium]
MNVVVLQGSLTRPAEHRSLPSGDSLVGLEMTVPRAGEKAESVPVVWPGAPAAAADLDVGEKVVVVGRVRRRFFRSGGVTQSRTEVVADVVVQAARTKRAKNAVARVAELLDDPAIER